MDKPDVWFDVWPQMDRHLRLNASTVNAVVGGEVVGVSSSQSEDMGLFILR